MDRHDRKVLRELAEKGPQFLLGSKEVRARDMLAKGLVERTNVIYSSSPTRREYRWRYRITDAGRFQVAG